MKKVGIVLCFLLVWLTGCDERETGKSLNGNEVKPSAQEPSDDTWYPYEVEDGYEVQSLSFGMDDTLLLTASGDKQVVAEYNGYNKEQTKIYETTNLLHSVHFYGNSKRYVIVESPSTFEATLTILDENHETVFRTSIPSAEITINVTDLDNDLLLAVTAFQEDWSYKSYTFAQDEFQQITGAAPFFYLKDENTLLQQEWASDTAYVGNIVERNIETGEQHVLLESVYTFSRSSNNWVFVSINEGEESTLTYRVTDDDLLEKVTISIPALAQYGDYYVPDYVVKGASQLMVWAPETAMDVDAYTGSFSLVAKSPQQNTLEELQQEDWSAPLSCQQNGEVCIIDGEEPIGLNVQTKKRLDLLDT